MPKPELEFFRPDRIAWEPVTASAAGGAGGSGVRQKILSKSEDGDVTRLLQFAAGVERPRKEHDLHRGDVRVQAAGHGSRPVPGSHGVPDAGDALLQKVEP